MATIIADHMCGQFRKSRQPRSKSDEKRPIIGAMGEDSSRLFLFIIAPVTFSQITCQGPNRTTSALVPLSINSGVIIIDQ